MNKIGIRRHAMASNKWTRYWRKSKKWMKKYTHRLQRRRQNEVLGR